MLVNRTLAALTIVGALVLGGCGDNGGDDREPDARDGQTPTVQPSDTPPGFPAAGQEVSAEEFLANVEDGARHYTTAHVTFTITAMSQITGSADIDYRTTPVSMRQVTKDSLLGNTTAITIGDLMYHTRGVGGPPKGMWKVTDLAKQEADLGVKRTDRKGFLSQVLSYRKGIIEVTSLGESIVSDAPAYGYELRVDRTKLQSYMRGMAAAEYEVKVWLDDKNRIVRFYVNTGKGITDNVMSDFDKKLKIVAPPASQVIDP